MPHHPEIATHPHHKHVDNAARGDEAIVAATPPDLSAILREIDQRLHR